MLEELWTEVHNIIPEGGIKTTPKEKKCKKAKWLSEEALQIAEKRREPKGKGEKERYVHLNEELQRIARRNFLKAFLSEKCKGMEENNIMGKTTDIFKKMRDQFSKFSCSVLSNSLRPREPQHVRPPCPSSAPGVQPNPCPSSWRYHPTISSSVTPISSCPQSFQHECLFK